VEEFSGLGLSALDSQDREWRYGAPRWAAAGSADDEHVRAVLSCGGHAVALFNVEETLRPGAEAAVAALRAAGVRVALLTGDGEARARALALRLGIDDVHAGVTPDGKLQVVAAAQRAGRVVAMVGDGINDAPVLALADVSLAMGQGALIARSQADAVLVASRPADVVLARNTARRALAIVRQNLVWAAGYNAISIPLALAGWLPPWAAGLGMAGSSLAVLANALRAGRVG
jgi:Cu2+-exporting ATPase